MPEQVAIISLSVAVILSVITIWRIVHIDRQEAVPNRYAKPLIFSLGIAAMIFGLAIYAVSTT